MISYFARITSASTSRNPSPLYGAALSQGMGVRLGCEPATGSAKMSDLAEVMGNVPGHVVMLLVDMAVEHGYVRMLKQ
jgi:hypothetical protein